MAGQILVLFVAAKNHGDDATDFLLAVCGSGILGSDSCQSNQAGWVVSRQIAAR